MKNMVCKNSKKITYVFKLNLFKKLNGWQLPLHGKEVWM
jgi:hypothetical protein